MLSSANAIFFISLNLTTHSTQNGIETYSVLNYHLILSSYIGNAL